MKNRQPLLSQKPFSHLEQAQPQQQKSKEPDFIVPVQPSKAAKNIVVNKTLSNAIKKSWQSGTFFLNNQSLKEFPLELCSLDEINLDGEVWWNKCPLIKIDLSANHIVNIPENLNNAFKDVTSFRVDSNKLSDLPHTLPDQMPSLKQLILSRNELFRFDLIFPQLCELGVSENKLTVLEGIDRMPYLEVLDVSQNQLSEVPYCGPVLKRLNMSKNKLKMIDRDSMLQSTQLEEVLLSKNIIEYIEDGTFDGKPRLKTLDLKENRLREFSQITMGANHPNMDSIQLSFNQMISYHCYEGMENLTVLLINDNKLKTLSSEILQLRGLRTLDLTNNDFSDIPSELGFLEQLVRIQLEGNPLKCIRPNLRTSTEVLKKYLKSRVATDDGVKNLEEKANPKLKQGIYQQSSFWETILRNFMTKDELIAKNQKINEIDLSVFGIDLKTLDLTQNNISTIPEEIVNLRNLKRFCLNENKLQTVPQGLLFLENLSELELRQNLLKDLPKQANLPNLSLLNLSLNQLGEIPKWVGNLRCLRVLNLAYNLVRTLDNIVNVAKPMRIEVLDLSNNQLETIDDKIYHSLPQLQHLNISNNSMKQIPTILGFIQLKTLQIDGNPTKLISRTLIDKGTVHILEYLKNKHPYDKIPQKIIQAQIEEEAAENYQNEFMTQANKKQGFQQNSYQGAPSKKQPYGQQYGNSLPQQQMQQQQFVQYQQQQLGQQNPLYNQQSLQRQQPQYGYEQQGVYQQKQQQLNPQLQQFPQQQQMIQQQIPVQANKEQIRFEIQNMEKEIRFLEREVNENFSLNKFQQQEKKKQLQSLMVRRGQLLQQLQ